MPYWFWVNCKSVACILATWEPKSDGLRDWLEECYLWIAKRAELALYRKHGLKIIVGLVLILAGCDQVARPQIRPMTVSEFWDIQARLNWCEGRAHYDRAELLRLRDRMKTIEEKQQCQQD